MNIGRAVRHGNDTDVDCRFEYREIKARVLQDIEDTCSLAFKRFYNTLLFDRFALTLILYFLSKFQHDSLKKALQRISSTSIEGLHLAEYRQKILDLEMEVVDHTKGASPLYAMILMKYGTYKNPHNDRSFFETLYRVTASILCQTFGQLGKDQEIEIEIGRLFRGNYFNSVTRKYEQPRSVETLTLHQLYEVKHESQNTSLNAKILSDLYKKRQNLDTKKASLDKSPLLKEMTKVENDRAMWSQISSSRDDGESPTTSPRQKSSATETKGNRQDITATLHALLEDEHSSLLAEIRRLSESVLFSTSQSCNVKGKEATLH